VERHLRSVESLEPLLSRESLAERLECSVDSVDRMRKAGMPAVRWGRKFVRFRYSDVVRWLDDQTQRAA
jgi:predicted DNA-binding transcriptional regulator AlpA